MAIGDLNGDGKPDLAVANFGSGNVSILLGTGAGAFGPANNFTVGGYQFLILIVPGTAEFFSRVFELERRWRDTS